MTLKKWQYIHGILATHGTFDKLIHEMDEITANDARRENKKVNWKKTKVLDNSNQDKAHNLLHGGSF